MNLLYLLLVMWPPPHLLRDSVGVWRYESAAINACPYPPGQRVTHRGAHLSRVAPSICGRWHALPVCVS